MTPRVPVGIIGGSGLYDIEGLEVLETITLDTPFGAPSAPITVGELSGHRVAFLPRHGKHHEFHPSVVPYRANIWALKQLGVFWTIAVNAVGSLREEIAPGDFVIPDQIIDKTTKRANTMYDDFVVHVNLGKPFHPTLRAVLLEACQAEGLTVHDGATYVTMEGPAFSTVAESHMHRQWGAHLIGMTASPEARLAREAEMCYASIAMPTDYDVWHETDEVDIQSIFEIFGRNVANVKKVLARALPMIAYDAEDACDASRALEYAIITKPEAISEKTRADFALVLSKYLS